MFRIIASSLTLSAALVSAAAFAEPATLRIDDLDLATEAGKATLDQRITRIANQMCRGTVVVGSRIPKNGGIKDTEQCRDAVRDEVMAKLAKKQAGRK